MKYACLLARLVKFVKESSYKFVVFSKQHIENRARKDFVHANYQYLLRGCERKAGDREVITRYCYCISSLCALHWCSIYLIAINEHSVWKDGGAYVKGE